MSKEDKSYMCHADALELVILRMKEDKISWAMAFDEYKQLTGYRTGNALEVGRYLNKLSRGVK